VTPWNFEERHAQPVPSVHWVLVGPGTSLFFAAAISLNCNFLFGP
jgi:hypothetical protein